MMKREKHILVRRTHLLIGIPLCISGAVRDVDIANACSLVSGKRRVQRGFYTAINDIHKIVSCRNLLANIQHDVCDAIRRMGRGQKLLVATFRGDHRTDDLHRQEKGLNTLEKGVMSEKEAF